MSPNPPHPNRLLETLIESDPKKKKKLNQNLKTQTQRNMLGKQKLTGFKSNNEMGLILVHKNKQTKKL